MSRLTIPENVYFRELNLVRKLRPREYLLDHEIHRLLEVCDSKRDQCLILLAYRHALRRTELVSLKWTQVDFNAKLIAIQRLKKSKNSTHPLTGMELELLEQLDSRLDSEFLFPGRAEGTHLEASGFWKLVKRSGEKAKFSFPLHPHMLKHSCGYKLTNTDQRDLRLVQEYMGHSDIRSTVIYTDMDTGRFESLWED